MRQVPSRWTGCTRSWASRSIETTEKWIRSVLRTMEIFTIQDLLSCGTVRSTYRECYEFRIIGGRRGLAAFRRKSRMVGDDQCDRWSRKIIESEASSIAMRMIVERVQGKCPQMNQVPGQRKAHLQLQMILPLPRLPGQLVNHLQ